MLTLQTPLSHLYGVGPKLAQKLQNLGLETARDLIFYFPRRFDDFSRPSKISQARIGEEIIIRAAILEIKNSRTLRKRMVITRARLRDASGDIEAIWFGQPFLINNLQPGKIFIFKGEIKYDFQNKKKVLQSPIYETSPSIFPVYSETEGLTSKYLRRLILPILRLTESIPDFLPEIIKRDQNLVDLDFALQQIHFPQNFENLKKAKERLAFDELFLISIRMILLRKNLQKLPAPEIKIDETLLKKFVKSLPFKLTDAQRKSAWEILKDLEKPHPANRLLEGDVGSGKTVVAAMAVLSASNSGYQSVWLAPTEILANQHFQNVSKLLEPFKMKVGLLTSATSKNSQPITKNSQLIIGTHALIQKDVVFPKLGLVIVDEQHRFGVKQRAYLRSREAYTDQANIIPHFLSMTATPIPRTLALSLYGDLDLSIIDEMPPGRQKVKTKLVSPSNRQKAYDFIRAEVKKGRQVFVVCPLIEPPSTSLGVNSALSLFELDRKSAVKEYEKLSKDIFPDLRIGLVHGKLKSKEKEEVMQKFKIGKIDILVSTAVIEVGIDIQNATVMMIEEAERFGLATLHQFRGRVGRGKHQSYCLLFSSQWNDIIKQRLGALTKYDSGFDLAEVDLKLRGPGELYGTAQSGLPDLKMASLTDIIMIKRAKESADKVAGKMKEYPQLVEKLREFEVERHLE